MQTQYKLLYRYMNQTTNTAVTNEAEYDKTEEFYTKDHKFNITKEQLADMTNKKYALKYEYEATVNGIAVGTYAETYADGLRKESDTDREVIITKNMANQEKSNLLFAYDGTKRIYHKKFIPEQIGYKVKHWEQVPESQRPDGPNDFSKHFVMLGGYKLGVDDAYLVCKPQYIEQYKKYKVAGTNTKCFLNLNVNDTKNEGYVNNADFFHQNTYINLNKIIDDNVMFEVCTSATDPTSMLYGESVVGGTITPNVDSTNGNTYVIYRTINNERLSSHPYNRTTSTMKYYFFFDNDEYGRIPDSSLTKSYSRDDRGSSGYGSYFTFTGWLLDELIDIGFTPSRMAETSVTIQNNNIMKAVIPEHYEDVGTNPYVIRDTYRTIPLSPWMIHSAHHSLESALTSAKTLVAMVGINNVKLIKYVPLDQFIKIQ